MKKIVFSLLFCSGLMQAALDNQTNLSDFDRLPSDMQQAVFASFDLEPHAWGRLALTHRAHEQKIVETYKKRWATWLKHLLSIADPRLSRSFDIDRILCKIKNIKEIHETGVALLQNHLDAFALYSGIELSSWSGLRDFYEYKKTVGKRSVTHYLPDGYENLMNPFSCRLSEICLDNHYVEDYLQIERLIKTTRTHYSCDLPWLTFHFARACLSRNRDLVKDFLHSIRDKESFGLPIIMITCVVDFIKDLVAASPTQSESDLVALVPMISEEDKIFIRDLVIAIRDSGIKGLVPAYPDRSALFSALGINSIGQSLLD